jgi:hypothetical protein
MTNGLPGEWTVYGSGSYGVIISKNNVTTFGDPERKKCNIQDDTKPSTNDPAFKSQQMIRFEIALNRSSWYH